MLCDEDFCASISSPLRIGTPEKHLYRVFKRQLFNSWSTFEFFLSFKSRKSQQEHPLSNMLFSHVAEILRKSRETSGPRLEVARAVRIPVIKFDWNIELPQRIGNISINMGVCDLAHHKPTLLLNYGSLGYLSVGKEGPQYDHIRRKLTTYPHLSSRLQLHIFPLP